MSTFDTKPFVKLVQPSLLSMIVCLALGLLVVGVLLFGLVTKNELYQQYVSSLEASPGGFYGGYQQVKDEINSSKVAADSSVFLFWSIIGMVGYYTVLGLLAVFTGVHSFLDHLSYKGIDKRSVLHDALLGLLMRIIAAMGLTGLLQITINEILPAVVTLFAGIDGFSVEALMPLAIVFLLGIVLVHAGIILTRLFLLRTRVFYSVNYIN